MLIFVKMALSSSDYETNILTISDFWDPPSRPSYKSAEPLINQLAIKVVFHYYRAFLKSFLSTHMIDYVEACYALSSAYVSTTYPWGGCNLHYANTPMLYTAIFHGCKIVNFQMKNITFFSYFCSKT